MALDQVVLEGERLHLAVGDDEIEVGDLLDHPGLVELGRPRGLEVRADAIAQHAGLADVEDLAPGVLEQIDAGPGRQLLELLGERHGSGARPAAAERPPRDRPASGGVPAGDLNGRLGHLEQYNGHAQNEWRARE